MIVRCDACGKAFFVTFQRITRQLHGMTVTKTFFSCPHCGHKYDVTWDSEETEQLRKRIQKQTTALNTIKSPNKYKTKLERIKRNQTNLGKEVKALQKLWEQSEKEL